MTTQAQYDATGQILCTLFPNPITDANQIAALTARGISLVTIPDGKSAVTGSIINGVYQDFPAPPPVIPNVMVQLAAALVNHGVVPVTAFHPTTVTEINKALSAVSMTAITPASIGTVAAPVS